MSSKSKALRGAISAAILTGLVLGACGAAAARSQTASSGVSQRVIQDPENPASRVYVGETQTPAGSRAIRDADNPYWTGNSASADLDLPGNRLTHGPY